MNLDQQIDLWLANNLGHEHFSPGLERLRSLFSPFKKQFQERKVKIITIGGTNGKGECAHCLHRLIQKEGKHCALWTSPHILSVTERFIFDDQPLEKDYFLDLLRREGDILKQHKLSYYEFLFYLFCKEAASRDHLDYLIFEVGLGGRLDAVNLFDADICALTSISRDHVEFLGNDLKSILKEKLGITRPTNLLFTTLESSYLRNMAHLHCQKLGTGHEDLFDTGVIEQETPYDLRNKHLAFRMAKELRVVTEKEDEVLNFLNDLELKGRWEKMTLGKRRFIFIGAHNVDGVRKMAQALVSDGKRRGVTLPMDLALLSFSKRSIKDVLQCLGIFQESPCLAKEIVLTEFNHDKAMELKDLAFDGLKTGKLKFDRNWQDILRSSHLDQESTVLVSGSYYFIGEVQKYLLSLYSSTK